MFGLQSCHGGPLSSLIIHLLSFPRRASELAVWEYIYIYIYIYIHVHIYIIYNYICNIECFRRLLGSLDTVFLAF